MTEALKLYFLGSGEIAVPVLEALVETQGIELLGVGSQQDRPAGRKRKLTPTPVSARVADMGLSVDKLDSVNSPEFLDRLKKLDPEIILVVSFGQILKEELLALPKVACVNIHASILPAYRGASPIAASILNGDDETGVTFMKMEKGLDSGPVYKIYKYKLSGNEKADSLELDLGRLAAQHAEDALLGIAEKQFKAEPQDESKASYSGKIMKSHGIVDWKDDGEITARKIRAYYPWPGMSFDLNISSESLKIRITEAEFLPEVKGIPGEVVAADKKDWIIACGKGALRLTKVVPQGKKEMSGENRSDKESSYVAES
jgi:methionyl-tRNA formyltransferase